ncbi:MAG: FG-GAP repeat domain-containing protein, partial [Planctomycetota bacterium]
MRTLAVVLALVCAIALFVQCGNGDEGGSDSIPIVRPSGALPFAYVDIAKAMGYTLRNRTGKDRAKDIILEAMPPGIAVGDFNNDGWMDLYCPNGNRIGKVDPKTRVPTLVSGAGAPRNELYWNRGGKRFEPAGSASGADDTTWSFGAVAGDIDNDGDTDIYLCNWGANRLYLNDGKGKFTEVAERSGAAGRATDWSSGAILFDLEGDVDLDIFVAQYGDVASILKNDNWV